MGKGGTRDLAKESAWRRRLARHGESGQTVRAWCRQHGVTEATFHWWRRELARRDAEQRSLDRRGAASPARSFVPVHVTDDSIRDGEGRIEVEFTDGRRVRVTGLVPRRVLTDVLVVLTSTSPVEAERRGC